MTAKWIVVSGLDGSGKTTLVENLVEMYSQQGYRVYQSRFPKDNYLRTTLLNKSKDSYTDRILFVLDNRITGTEVQEAMDSGEYDIVITQRGFLDSFVHGAVQGYTYEMVEALNHFSDMPKCDIMIHMVAEANVAYERIADDPDADKFEYLEYIEKQELETRRAYNEIRSGKNSTLAQFSRCKNIYVDTTEMTTDETFEWVKKKLYNLF